MGIYIKFLSEMYKSDTIRDCVNYCFILKVDYFLTNNLDELVYETHHS